MSGHFRNRIIFATALGLGLSAVALAGQATKAKPSGFQTVENKHCGYWIRYPKGSQLEHPSDCALRIVLPATGWPEWIREATLTLYTAPPGQEPIGETPAGESTSTSFLVAGGLKFSKTIFEDAAMSHRYITVLYEAQGKNHKYRLQGLLTAAVPEVMDLKVKNWDPQKSAEKIFDGLALSFRALE